MLADQPNFSTTDAERIARDHYGVDGRATQLTSERDQNFLIEAPDLDAAIGWAARCPGASSDAVEVRPILTFAP